MSNLIENSVPFAQQLGDNERYRFRDGQLIIEDSSVRSSANGWTRFWTRGQYSQSAILKKMKKLYRKAEKQREQDNECHLTNVFLENYTKLIDRAKIQNDAFEGTSCIVRFFKAKSFISVSSHEDKLIEIEAILNPVANPDTDIAPEPPDSIDDLDSPKTPTSQKQDQAELEAILNPGANLDIDIAPGTPDSTDDLDSPKTPNSQKQDQAELEADDNLNLWRTELEELQNSKDDFIQRKLNVFKARRPDAERDYCKYIRWLKLQISEAEANDVKTIRENLNLWKMELEELENSYDEFMHRRLEYRLNLINVRGFDPDPVLTEDLSRIADQEYDRNSRRLKSQISSAEFTLQGKQEI